MKNIFTSIIVSLSLIITGCKKFVTVDAPVTSTNAANVYATDATAIGVLTGLYAKLSATSSQYTTAGGLTTFSLFGGLSADEYKLYSGVGNPKYIAYYQNQLSPGTAIGVEFWNNTYPNIFQCNSAIEGLNASTTLTPSVKQQLLGEAKFLRAFFYFYLVNLYGDVPLALSSDYKHNAVVGRTSKDSVYNQIVADLKDAQDLLSASYLRGDLLGTTTDRVRPTKWAAKALLARTYLYIGDWANAEAQTTDLINSSLFSLTATTNAFSKTSTEAIWQLQPVISNHNVEDARLFVIPSTGFSGDNYPVYLSTYLLNSFEPNDQRKIDWIGKYTDTFVTPAKDYYYPFKYKIFNNSASLSEYLMVLRLGEQYLIRAEARAQQNKTSEAKNDLDVIRTRANLPGTTANDKASLLTAILHERQDELFSEWGHRWLDLKRTGNADAVMSIVTPAKGGIWQPTDKLYPIPQSDIDKNPNLIQTPGY